MTSYFEKYEKLLDSNFQDFIAHELHTGLCEVLPDNSNLLIKQLVLQRRLIGEGSHRHLSSSMRFDIDPEPFSQLPFHQCEVIIVERLPHGVFADPFELQHLHHRGGKLHSFFMIKFKNSLLLKTILIVLLIFLRLISFSPRIAVFTDVAVFGDTNLELPSFRSNQSAVEIHINVGSDIFLSQKNGLEIKIQLPLHARYQVSKKDVMVECCFYIFPFSVVYSFYFLLV